MLILIVVASVAAFALIGRGDRETIEPQPGVFTEMPEGWDVVSSSTPDGTARIPDDKNLSGPTLTPEEFASMSVEETIEYEGPSLYLSSVNSCTLESEDVIISTDLPVGSGYDQMDSAIRQLDTGRATVARREAIWSVTYGAMAFPYREEPGDPDTAEYPDYNGRASLDVCIEELDLYISYSIPSTLSKGPSGSVSPPSEDRNASLAESREEVNNEIRSSYEENIGVMIGLLEDIDTDGWDGPTDVSDLPTELDAYDEILADPFDGELDGEISEAPELPDAETTTPEVEQERTLDYTTTPAPETTAAGGPEPGAEERFLFAYFSAASVQDWYFTYQSLSDESKALFTLDEWREAQEARIEQTGGTAPLQDAEILSLIGDAAGATADVSLTYEDGTQETVTDVGIMVDGNGFRRKLTSDEISYLQGLIEDDGTSNPECGIWGCPDENGEYTDAPPKVEP